MLKAKAFLLLVLLLGIHIFKLLHTHEAGFKHFYGKQPHEIVALDKGEKALHCAVCHYQLTGNINTGFISIEPQIPLFASSFICFSESIFASPAIAITGRGPPSLLV